MEYTVTDIKYDTDEQGLPKELVVEVPADIVDPVEIVDYISDEISNQTGWCHQGFNTNPEIQE
jgi:hypothetical protein